MITRGFDSLMEVRLVTISLLQSVKLGFGTARNIDGAAGKFKQLHLSRLWPIGMKSSASSASSAVFSIRAGESTAEDAEDADGEARS